MELYEGEYCPLQPAVPACYGRWREGGLICIRLIRLGRFACRLLGSVFGINESAEIQLDGIIAKCYADCVNNALMLGELSKEDVQRTIESLRLSEIGTPQSELTEDEFKQKISFHVDGEILVLRNGTRYVGEPDEKMFRYDLARGK